jgi:Tol biopolymer transport system component
VGQNANLRVFDLARSTSGKLTTEGRVAFVNWTPDGSRATFGYSKAGVFNLFWMPWDGSGSIERLTTAKYTQYPGSWSPNGRVLAFVEENLTSWDIWLLDIQTRRASPLLATRHAEGWPEFSPDGRYIAYASDESGRMEVYVMPFPGAGPKVMISNEGGCAPVWARNARELFYWSLGWEKLMVVAVSMHPNFRVGTPRPLFEFRCPDTSPLRNYDISWDGRRFLIPEPFEFKASEVTHLNIVLNWFEELKRVVPTGAK